MSQELNTVIDGRYTLTHLVGRGGVGEVWRATQAPLNRTVALKLIRPEYAGDAQIRRRFAREARAASGLAHPNVAAVFDFGADENEQLFMAMEIIEGPSVSQAIETGLSVRNILEMADQLLGGLAHAHARGVVHRDLKPDNIVLSGAKLPESIGIPKIVDFGIASIIDKKDGIPDPEPETHDRATLRGEVIGTPRYMSPEQATGERNLSPRTDLYNIGLLLYEIITGARPFGESKGLDVMSRHVHDPIPAIIPRAGLELPEDIAPLVMRALEKDPLGRWGSAAEMRAALKPLLERSRELPEANIAPEPLVVIREEPTPVDNPALASGQQEVEEIIEVSDEEIEWVQPWQLSFRTPFVGRERERALLTDLVKTVTDHGRGSILLLSGEAGVGKTRLTEWLKEHVEENGFMRANSGAFSRGTSSSLRGVQDVLESMFRTRGLARVELGSKITDRLKRWDHASPEDAAGLTDFLRPSRQDDTRPTSVSTSSLFAMIARVFEVAARSKPRLIILDDIHWAGREFADFLEFIAIEMRHRNIPVLLVGTIRTEDLNERPELATRLHALSRYTGETVEKVELTQFGGKTGRNLVEALLPTDDSLAEIVLERCSGNPLHISFLLRYLRDVGLLHLEHGRWHAHDIDEVRNAVPPSLGDLFSVRIEQAEAHYKIDGRLNRVLQYAAVAGPRFQFDVLQHMVERGGESEVCQHFEYDLDRLVSEGFIREIDGRGDDWYGFVHGLLRDYLLAGIRPLVARSLHRNAAEAKAEVYGKQADAEAMDIAGHWKSARNADHALHWFQRAALTAQRSFRLPQSAKAYEEALDIMDDLLGLRNLVGDPLLTALNQEKFGEAGVPIDDYLHALSRLGDLHEGFGQFERAEELYRRVVRIVGKDIKTADDEALSPLGYSWLGIGHIAWQRGDFEAAEWAFQKVRTLVEYSESHRKLDSHAARDLRGLPGTAQTTEPRLRWPRRLGSCLHSLTTRQGAPSPSG